MHDQTGGAEYGVQAAYRELARELDANDLGAFELPGDVGHHVHGVRAADTDAKPAEATCNADSEDARRGGNGRQSIQEARRTQHRGGTQGAPPLGVWESVPIMSRPGKA